MRSNYKATIDTPPARKVFHYFQDWANKYRLGGPQYTDARTDFLGGRLATDCSFGIWGIPQMEAAKIDWSVHPAPRFEGAVSDNGMDIYAFYMMVNARSSPAAQKAAWKLVRFYTDHAEELFAGAGLFVPRKEVTESEAYKSNPAAPFFLAELKKAQFSPRVVGYDQVLDAMLRGRDKMLQGETVEFRAAGDERRGECRAEPRARARRSNGQIARLRVHFKWWGLVFVLPAVGFFAAFNVFPMLFGLLPELHGLRPARSAARGSGSTISPTCSSDRLFLTAFAQHAGVRAGRDVAGMGAFAAGRAAVRPGISRARHNQGGVLPAGAAAGRGRRSGLADAAASERHDDLADRRPVRASPKFRWLARRCWRHCR